MIRGGSGRPSWTVNDSTALRRHRRKENGTCFLWAVHNARTGGANMPHGAKRRLPGDGNRDLNSPGSPGTGVGTVGSQAGPWRTMKLMEMKAGRKQRDGRDSGLDGRPSASEQGQQNRNRWRTTAGVPGTGK